MKHIRIEVTRADIMAGLPGNPDACPIALALGRAGVVGAWVGDDHFGGDGLDPNGSNLSKRARSFVSAFDEASGKAKPFAAVLRAREESK